MADITSKITGFFEGLSPGKKLLLNLSAPFILGGAYFSMLFVALPFGMFEKLMGLMVINLIPPAGKESVIPLGIALGIPWWIIASSTAMMDVCAGLFMALNFDLATKIPFLGPWISGFMDSGEAFFKKRPWIERLSEAGLVVFVMVPFQGSGGVGGTLVGRMLGMPKMKVFFSIAIGAFLGSYLIALGFEYVIMLFKTDLMAAVAVVLLVIAIAAAVYFYRRKSSRKLRSIPIKKKK
ncbi:small multi-drug export protein [Methanoplanus sp. FWC-SCC4]|uniref:Small multi-drug export protein n=1 Tax=Methanochimaera problematica TaxID=2609417 RepID=A0AA97I3N8_9EURY|nr:small multi-drug export protein [Methanoplanus sp. FWC-SCC4]WOF16903.1 small multi-drug export protein [Methanoplanus sp. FWC-SCC4]